MSREICKIRSWIKFVLTMGTGWAYPANVGVCAVTEKIVGWKCIIKEKVSRLSKQIDSQKRDGHFLEKERGDRV